MNMLEFEDSEMSFGPFPESDCYRIEHSALHESINKKSKKGEGIKIAEFLLLRQARDQDFTIWIVEAKKSFARQETQ